MTAFQPLDVIRSSASVKPAEIAPARDVEVAKLIDVSKCIGCKACQVACLEWNNMREEVGYNHGVYDNPLGPTPTLVTLNAGSHIVETLTSGPGPKLVDFAGAVYNVPELGSETINLSPVVPPKPKGS